MSHRALIGTMLVFNMLGMCCSRDSSPPQKQVTQPAPKHECRVAADLLGRAVDAYKIERTSFLGNLYYIQGTKELVDHTNTTDMMRAHADLLCRATMTTDFILDSLRSRQYTSTRKDMLIELEGLQSILEYRCKRAQEAQE